MTDWLLNSSIVLLSPPEAHISGTEHLIVMASSYKPTLWLGDGVQYWAGPPQQHVIFPEENHKNIVIKKENLAAWQKKKKSSFRQIRYMSPCLRDEKSDSREMIRITQSHVDKKTEESNIKVHIILLWDQYFFCYYFIFLWSPLNATITKTTVYWGPPWLDTALHTYIY